MPLGVGRGQNVGLKRFLPYFDFVAAGGIRVSQTQVYYYGYLTGGGNTGNGRDRSDSNLCQLLQKDPGIR